MALLNIENLTVEFKTSSGAFRAVDRLSLTIEHNEVLAIVGESGSGKSVAMLAVMDLLPWTATVSADKLEFNGIDLPALSKKARRRLIGSEISMIFQEPMTSLNPCFTVGFQLSEAIQPKVSRKARKKACIELLQLVGIPAPEQRLSAFPHQLSGGMSQRVMIAMAIASNPKLLIADEPTTALDVTIQAQILELLLDIQQQTDRALVLITHDMGVVAETAQRVQVQYAGQKVEEQSVGDLFNTPHHPYTAALLAALPERATGRMLPSIPGVVPGQHDRPAGCLFAPRCASVQARCRREAPPPPSSSPPSSSSALGKLSTARCHFPLQYPAKK